jgi:glycosyltransferase involved in cell wall biosynthesis
MVSVNLLYLSPWFPFPPTNGSELRINALLRGLAAVHDVTLISFRRRPVDEAHLKEACRLLREVHLIPWREFNPGSARARLGFFSSKPRSVIDTYSDEMATAIRKQVVANQFDVIVASELVPAAYHAEFASIPALIDDLELGVYAQAVAESESIAQHTRRRLMWAKQRAYVRDLLPRFAACTVVSERERALLREVAPDYDPVEVIPNCINLADYRDIHPPKEPATLIFTGAFTYGVNYDAMVWFLGEIYPLVQRVVPDVRLVITGNHAGKPLPPAENVTLTGYIDDVKTPVAAAAVSLVPIRQGGGTRLKILEAMALGTPVVSTTKGAEGLEVTAGEHLLLADTPEEFAAAVVRLLKSPALRQNLVNNACHLVQQQYDWATAMPRFLALVDRVAGPRPQR